MDSIQIKTIDLSQNKKETVKAMICQFYWNAFNSKYIDDLYFLNHDEKIESKIKSILIIAKNNRVDLIVLPELSIPEKMIENLVEFSKDNDIIIIAGTHYKKNKDQYISRCPIIIDGKVFFTEKINPAPSELSPCCGNGLSGGKKLLIFKNSSIGNFSVLICADYISNELKQKIGIETLDILCVPSFQKDSNMYYSRMGTDIQNAKDGLYILYSNFIENKVGDGKSALFGIIDNMYKEKLESKGYTDSLDSNKLFQFKDDIEYCIFSLNIENKKPYKGNNLYSKPNVNIIEVDKSNNKEGYDFLAAIGQDAEMYKNLDSYYVLPSEYFDIAESIERENIVFIIGDPGIGKTYTAVKLLFDYYKKGYKPRWILGLGKEDREYQRNTLINFIPMDNEIVYFEDPFGRSSFERRDELYQIFTPLVDKIRQSKSKIIITSRTEVFEQFTNESLTFSDLIAYKKELNIRNPSYSIDKLKEIFRNLAIVLCPWYNDNELVNIVDIAIEKKQIVTPFVIRDLILGTNRQISKYELKNAIAAREKELTRAFAIDISISSTPTIVLLYLVFFIGKIERQTFTATYEKVLKRLKENGFLFQITSLSSELDNQLGYRIDQIGSNKIAYRFSHIIYEEALAKLIISNSLCLEISKIILEEVLKIDLKLSYKLLQFNIIRHPEATLKLYKHLLFIQTQKVEEDIRISFCLKMLSTSLLEFKKLSLELYPYEELRANLSIETNDLNLFIFRFELFYKYYINAPYLNIVTDIKNIVWVKIFSSRKIQQLNANQIVYHLGLLKKIDPDAISLVAQNISLVDLRRKYICMEKIQRKYFEDIIKPTIFNSEILALKTTLSSESAKGFGLRKLVNRYLFNDYKYSGTLIVDDGAAKALNKRYTNLLPIGVKSVIGTFERGNVVRIMNSKKMIIGVGMVEYSSEELQKIKGHMSSEIQELLGYYSDCAAIRANYRIWVYPNHAKRWHSL